MVTPSASAALNQEGREQRKQHTSLSMVQPDEPGPLDHAVQLTSFLLTMLTGQIVPDPAVLVVYLCCLLVYLSTCLSNLSKLETTCK